MNCHSRAAVGMVCDWGALRGPSEVYQGASLFSFFFFFTAGATLEKFCIN